MRCLVQSPEAMVALGKIFGETAVGGEVYSLDGPLGAGKTQWVKGLGLGLSVTSIVNSPTFTIVKEHVGRLTLQHVDLYRVGSQQECFDLALEDLLNTQSVLAVEWACRCSALKDFQTHTLVFEMGQAESERVIALSGENFDMTNGLLARVSGIVLL